MTEAPRAVNSIVIAVNLRHPGTMRVVFQIVMAGLLVGACGPLSIYYRPGVEVSRLESDTTRCQVIALRDAPVANQIRQSPPMYMPYYGYGGGYWAGGGIYSVDVNAELRARVLNMCMAEKGYQPVNVPRCSDAVARQVPFDPTQTLPSLSRNSCAIPYRDGTWQIVTPQVTTAAQ
ncbi:hypothetical protein I5535_07130 [Rhodobacteraceae bacterium F11138]|nr:hypothetical protein [Rhodobacteraceae bacterium F11138]